MTNINGGVLDGLRRIGAAVRSLSITGGISGAPLGVRLLGANTLGPPQTGTWKAGDKADDRAGNSYICTAGGTGAGATWVRVGANGIFGTGTDGAVTLDGTTTYNGFSSLAGSIYTLTRDVQASSLTINNGVTLKTANYRVFCTGTITNNGTISNAGNNASGGTGGGVSSGASLGGGRGGGAGGTGVSGTGGNGTAASAGSAGGNGGAGTSGAAGSGANPTGPSAANAGNNPLALPFAALTSILIFGTFQGILQFGCGGGGGGSDLASNAGGGGGGGGNIIALFAAAVVNNGTITAAGGNGAAGTGGNAGGGGGGAGGAILVYTLTAWTAGTTNVAGGSLGAGSGTGSNGVAGGNGLVLNSVLK